MTPYLDHRTGDHAEYIYFIDACQDQLPLYWFLGIAILIILCMFFFYCLLWPHCHHIHHTRKFYIVLPIFRRGSIEPPSQCSRGEGGGGGKGGDAGGRQSWPTCDPGRVTFASPRPGHRPLVFYLFCESVANFVLFSYLYLLGPRY